MEEIYHEPSRTKTNLYFNVLFFFLKIILLRSIKIIDEEKKYIKHQVRGAVQEVRNFYHKGVKGAQWKEEDIDFCFLSLRAPSVPLWSILFGQPHCSCGSW